MFRTSKKNANKRTSEVEYGHLGFVESDKDNKAVIVKNSKSKSVSFSGGAELMTTLADNQEKTTELKSIIKRSNESLQSAENLSRITSYDNIDNRSRKSETVSFSDESWFKKQVRSLTVPSITGTTLEEKRAEDSKTKTFFKKLTSKEKSGSASESIDKIRETGVKSASLPPPILIKTNPEIDVQNAKNNMTSEKDEEDQLTVKRSRSNTSLLKPEEQTKETEETEEEVIDPLKTAITLDDGSKKLSADPPSSVKSVSLPTETIQETGELNQLTVKPEEQTKETEEKVIAPLKPAITLDDGSKKLSADRPSTVKSVSLPPETITETSELNEILASRESRTSSPNNVLPYINADLQKKQDQLNQRQYVITEYYERVYFDNTDPSALNTYNSLRNYPDMANTSINPDFFPEITRMDKLSDQIKDMSHEIKESSKKPLFNDIQCGYQMVDVEDTAKKEIRGKADTKVHNVVLGKSNKMCNITIRDASNSHFIIENFDGNEKYVYTIDPNQKKNNTSNKLDSTRGKSLAIRGDKHSRGKAVQGTSTTRGRGRGSSNRGTKYRRGTRAASNNRRGAPKARKGQPPR